MSSHRQATLNTGAKVDLVGYGTWQSAPGEVGPAVTAAIKAGYRHIDCAIVYGNQPEVAEGIKAGGVPRDQLFIVSKLWNNSHRVELVEKDLDATLRELDTPYLDAYLIHWPVAMVPGGALLPLEPNSDPLARWIDRDAPPLVETWKEVVRIYRETDKVRAIGVSNFNKAQLEEMIAATGVVPAFNQIEAHPGLVQPELFAYCKEKGIQITAYSPTGNNTTGKAKMVDLPEIVAIANKLGKQPAQVCIQWAAHQGFCVIPKSVTPSRIAANFEDFELSDEDFEAISAAGRAHPVRGNVPAQYTPALWPINIFDTEAEKKFSLKPW